MQKALLNTVGAMVVSAGLVASAYAAKTPRYEQTIKEYQAQSIEAAEQTAKARLLNELEELEGSEDLSDNIRKLEIQLKLLDMEN